MTAKDRLRQLVDELPEDEAAEALERLQDWRSGRGTIAGLDYGPDDEPLTEADRKGIEEGRAAIAAGDQVDEQALRERLNALRSRR
jgi:hypothetical protein